MQKIAILGRQPELGLIELESLLTPNRLRPFGTEAALATDPPPISQLGGSQKIGRIIYTGPSKPLDQALRLDDLPAPDGKTTFGLSYYGSNINGRRILAAGLDLKKLLKSRGPARLVTPKQGTTLTAAQIKFNKLLTGGFELLIVNAADQMLIAITEEIQDIDWYSHRDYDRPARDPKVGMLPPKLAQIMINTTRAPLVYDPFCGSGVVLAEALLLGRQAAGSDLDQHMVDAANANLKWLQQQVESPLPAWSVNQADAVSVKLPPPPISVVSEGYLGNPLHQEASPEQVKQLQSELDPLYRRFLINIGDQLKSGSEITICLPVWKQANHWQSLPLIDGLTDLGYTKRQFVSTSQPLIYHREGQAVGRQILILRKT